jgi:hypothetical protein
MCVQAAHERRRRRRHQEGGPIHPALLPLHSASAAPSLPSGAAVVLRRIRTPNRIDRGASRPPWFQEGSWRRSSLSTPIPAASIGGGWCRRTGRRQRPPVRASRARERSNGSGSRLGGCRVGGRHRGIATVVAADDIGPKVFGAHRAERTSLWQDARAGLPSSAFRRNFTAIAIDPVHATP